MKKFDIKSICMGLVAGTLVTCGVGVASTLVAGDVYFSSYPIFVNGKQYSSSDPVLNYNGRTYLPLNEMGKVLGGTVSFYNNTIYVSGNSNSYIDNSGTRDKVYNFTETVESDIDIEKDSSESYYVSLSRFGARSATITGGNSYVKVNKSSMTYSGDIKLTGLKEGEATIKITYNTGDVEKLYVNVTDDEDEYEDEATLEVGDTYKINIDLDEYDADEAKVTYDSKYVSVSKTKFTSDGKLTITAEKKGDTTVKIKYDSGDTVYIELEIVDDKSDKEKEIYVGKTYKVDIDLDEYDADEAKVTYDSDYVKVSKTTFTNDGTLTITAKETGKTTVKIKYDSGDTQYVYLKIYDDDCNTDYDDVEVAEGEYEYVYINLDEYNAKSATLTYNNSYIKLDKTSLTSNGKVKVTGRKEGYTSIKVKFNTGKIIYIDIEVTD